MYCSTCGAYTPNNAQFCPKCGSRLEAAPAEAPSYGPAPQGDAAASQRPVQVTVKVKNRHYGRIILILLLLAGVGFYMLHYVMQSPKQTLEIFCDSMSTLDYRSALNCVDGGSDELYDGTLDVLGGLTGIDLGGYGKLLQGIGGLTASAGLTPTIEVEILSIDYTDGYTWLDAKHCTVSAAVKLTGAGYDGMEAEDWTVDMTRSGFKWLIDADEIADLF